MGKLDKGLLRDVKGNERLIQLKAELESGRLSPEEYQHACVEVMRRLQRGGEFTTVPTGLRVRHGSLVTFENGSSCLLQGVLQI